MERSYVVPGRVELVGKHVDYAGGRSITCATDCAMHAMATFTREPVLHVRDSVRRSEVRVALTSDARADGPPWGAYVAAVARRLARDFPHARCGAHVVIRSDLPSSAGLSSSTALVVTMGMILVDANALDTDSLWTTAIPTPIACAEYFAAMETGSAYAAFAGDAGVGVRGGAQDHVAIVCSEAGHVGQFHYLPPRAERFVAWPEGFVIALGVSGVRASKRGNAQASYNRLADAMRAMATIGAPAHPTSDLAARIAQFREETDVIVPGVGDALAAGNMATLGALVDRSQALAEHVLGNQVPETVFLAREARAQGAVAASAFGAGFGGAVWAMVARADADAFLARWSAAYGRTFPARIPRARWLLTTAAAGARTQHPAQE